MKGYSEESRQEREACFWVHSAAAGLFAGIDGERVRRVK